MVISVWSATISPGKRSEAEDFWKRITDYNKKQPGVEDSIVMHPLQGSFSRIMRSTEFSSLAAMEEMRKKTGADPERLALRKEQQKNQYHIPGTLERNTYQVVE